jgi:hypothetical protein
VSVDAADVAALLAMEGEFPDTDELLPLTSIPAVLAFLATKTRADGGDEADAVELAVRAADLKPSAARASERVLRRLGYVAVADRLREIAGRRKNGLKPLA